MTLRISPYGALIMGGLMALPQVQVSAASRELEAEDGWARATAPGQKVAAGYLELRNGTQRADAVIAASSPVAAAVELHTASLQNGIMRMRRLDRLVLPAGGTVRLAPGRQHLMLMGLRQPLVAGQSVSVTLRLASGRTVTTRLAVRHSNATRHEDNPHHEHD